MISKIISITKATTKNGHPMWRCVLDNGEKVNVFVSDDPKRDTAHFFDQAGYGQELADMATGQERSWNQCPIFVDVEKDGQWWTIVGVEKRPEGAGPDPAWAPDPKLARMWAIIRAEGVVSGNTNVVFFDTETTGVGRDDEIISIALGEFGREPLIKSLIKPVDLSRVAVAQTVHGISVEDLADAPTFQEIHQKLDFAFENEIMCGYNVEFDMRMLEQDCYRHDLVPPTPLAVIDAMPIVSAFFGEWDYGAQRWKPKKLSEAAAHFGIDTSEAHDAWADVQLLMEMLDRIGMEGY